MNLKQIPVRAHGFRCRSAMNVAGETTVLVGVWRPSGDVLNDVGLRSL